MVAAGLSGPPQLRLTLERYGLFRGLSTRSLPAVGGHLFTASLLTVDAQTMFPSRDRMKHALW